MPVFPSAGTDEILAIFNFVCEGFPHPLLEASEPLLPGTDLLTHSGYVHHHTHHGCSSFAEPARGSGRVLLSPYLLLACNSFLFLLGTIPDFSLYSSPILAANPIFYSVEKTKIIKHEAPFLHTYLPLQTPFNSSL